MATKNHSTTTTIPVKGFAPHGTMDLRVQEQLNVMEARGPFNLQLVLAAEQAQEQVDAALRDQAQWATLLLFRESALATFDALAEIEAIVRRRLAQGLCPLGVALVLEPAVEGASLMGPLYLKAYVNAGVNARLFAHEDAARAWLAGLRSAAAASP